MEANGVSRESNKYERGLPMRDAAYLVHAYWRLMRPHQWAKNVLVLLGLLYGFAWATPETFREVALVFVAFCFAASAIYVLNDMIDVESDRAHPKKCRRPLASGEVSTQGAAWLGGVLVTTSLVLAGFASHAATSVIVAYMLLNIAYSFKLKHMVLLDVFGIAMGFQLRILAGTVAVGLPPSRWMLLTGLMFTLFLGFAKRRAELIAGGKSRKVLEHYSAALLDKYLSGTGIATAICYGLYTVDAETVAKHHTDALLYTVPFVLFAIFRYLFLIHKHALGEDPSRDLLRDRQMMLSGCLWALSTALILYVAPRIA